MPRNTVLVVGASGLVGQATLEHFAARDGWDVIGTSRRPPAPAVPGTRFVSVDLLDEAACNAAYGAMSEVTHLVYAAVQEKPGLFEGWIDPEMVALNGKMFRNLFEPLARSATGLRHVSLLHGTKAYGVHHPDLRLRGARIPLREREPRREHPNFYWEQEDYLRAKQQQGATWTLTLYRPTVIYGGAFGNNLNPIPAMAAYAALLRERREPLHFPGRYFERSLREAVDADLVASAIGWASESPAAANEAFNLTNGDLFTWPDVWPAIARSFGMEPGEHRPLSLAEWIPGQQAAWEAMVREHQLVSPSSVVDFVGRNSLIYTDMVLGGNPPPPVPMVNSTIRARLAGFHDCIDTEDMFTKWFDRFQRDRYIPPRP